MNPSEVPSTTISQCGSVQRCALTSFYDGISNADSTLSNWLDGNECAWTGVTCVDNVVTQLSLSK